MSSDDLVYAALPPFAEDYCASCLPFPQGQRGMEGEVLGFYNISCRSLDMVRSLWCIGHSFALHQRCLSAESRRKNISRTRSCYFMWGQRSLVSFCEETCFGGSRYTDSLPVSWWKGSTFCSRQVAQWCSKWFQILKAQSSSFHFVVMLLEILL